MTSLATGRPASSRPPGDRPRAVLRATGELLLTLGLVLLLFCAYELWFTGIATAHDQTRLGRDLDRGWSAPAAPAAAAPDVAVPSAAAPVPGAPSLGDAYARFYLPTLQGDRALVVVEGVGVEDLKRGPGHWPRSAVPGAVGNLVLSGHRTTYGAPFSDLDRLRPGDPLVVETRDAWVTYRVTGSEVVLPTDVGVSLPVPEQPGVAPTQALITLTTCHPKLSARQRLVVSGLLAEVRPKAQGRPAALSGS